MLTDISLLNKFKCMATNCPYTGNCVDKMLLHLHKHEQTSGYSTDYLHCAYCSTAEFSSPENLINHIISTHTTSIIQCQYCFYRSVDAFACATHLSKYHAGHASTLLTSHTDISKAIAEMYSENIDHVSKTRGVVPLVCSLGTCY